MKHQKYFNRFFLIVFLFCAGCTCSFSQYSFLKANRLTDSGQYQLALKEYEKLALKKNDKNIALESLRRAARIADVQLGDFNKAIALYRRLILLSPNASERQSTQKMIADIYFEKLNDYSASISEYNKFLILKLPVKTKVETLLRIAKSHYYKSEFFQAEAEAKQALSLSHDNKMRFEIELFLANILYNTKKMDEAIENYKNLIQQYPKLSQSENVEMSLVVALEETQRIAEAIDTLETMKSYYPEPDFIDLKLKSLEQRRKNLPGHKGLRK